MDFDTGKEGANGAIVIIRTGNFAAVASCAACALRHQHSFRRVNQPDSAAIDIFLLTAKK
ncbi:hypothetical protein D3C81_2107440 [compost metagenome]